MTEATILEKIETLNQAVARLQERIEDLEDLRDIEEAIAENAGKLKSALAEFQTNRVTIATTCVVTSPPSQSKNYNRCRSRDSINSSA